MIHITDPAQAYFKRLIDQQDENDLGLRIQVLDAGTPGAGCDLQFCPVDDHPDSDEQVAFDGFDLYVAAESMPWLDDAEIDFEHDTAGGQLTIRAPNIKGQMPSEDAPLADRIAWILETEVNPRLASHGGQVTLEAVTRDQEVVLRFGGGCHGCGMVDVTLKQGIEKTLKEQFPEISGIVDATDHASGENPYYAPR